jgi:hypothetical protein
MSDKRKTAVEYLKNNLPSLFQDDQSGFYTTLFERAKTLEREQIEDAYEIAFSSACDYSRHDIEPKYEGASEYYEQTYGE